jgi:hypothetical protein
MNKLWINCWQQVVKVMDEQMNKVRTTRGGDSPTFLSIAFSHNLSTSNTQQESSKNIIVTDIYGFIPQISFAY